VAIDVERNFVTRMTIVEGVKRAEDDSSDEQ
jgi:hypothetical protein